MATPNDPFFFSQFHLSNPFAFFEDLNVVDVWDDYTGKGVKVGVVDDGFDLSHADLVANYDTTLDADILTGDGDASAETRIITDTILVAGTPVDVVVGVVDESHGTQVMGLIGAAENGTGVVGVAHEATLAGYRLGLADNGKSLASSAVTGLKTAVDNGMDVVNMSLGSPTAFASTADSHVEHAIETGRDVGGEKLGTIVVKSNGNERNDDVPSDGNAEAANAHRGTVSVAAVEYTGAVSEYSSSGANLLVSAFGTGIPGSIVTTDRSGANGASESDVSTTFNGTSAAAPQVSGVVALMLEANPDLGWRDVQEILAYSASHIGSEVGAAASGDEIATRSDGSTWFWNDAENWNGGGLHFSNDYGFGLVDAKAAVRLAETWERKSFSANEDSTFLSLNGSGAPVENLVSASFSATETESQRIEYVDLSLELDVDAGLLTGVSDLEIFLTSPEGTTVRMIGDIGGTRELDRFWTFGTHAFRGEDSAGVWSVSVIDDFEIIGFSTGSISVGSVSLRTYGEDSRPDDDLFIFTEEYSDFAGVAGHSTNINGSSGAGIDTLNSAAVDSNTFINLQSNNFFIDGVNGQARNIDRVYTGEGDDLVTGDAVSDFISTGRGDDIVQGGSGDEEILGGEGDDDLSGGDGDDLIDGGAGADVINGQGGDDVIRGGGSSDTLDGGAGVDTLLVDEFDGVFSINMIDGGTNFAETAVNFENVTLGDGTNGVVGTDAANIIILNGGDDVADGRGGADTILGGDGDDEIRGGAGDDFMDGGAGVDTLLVSEFGGVFNLDMATGVTNSAERAVNFENVVTGNGANSIMGTDGANVITLNGGSDFADGRGGDDTIRGGGGGDNLSGGAGRDTLDGGEGDDFISGGAGADFMDGGNGDDTLNAGEMTTSFVWDMTSGLTNIFDLTPVGATLFPVFEIAVNFENALTGAEDDDITGTVGANVIIVNDGDDTVDAGAGDDQIFGGAGADVIQGGDGADIIDDGEGDDIVNGGEGDDLFRLSSGADVIDGGGGRDEVDAGGQADLTGKLFRDVEILDGDGGDLTVNAGQLHRFDEMTDVLSITLATGGSTNLNSLMRTGEGFDVDGSEFNDIVTVSAMDVGAVLDGGEGDDVIRAGLGDDTVFGGSGADRLVGGAGDDAMTGEEGDDVLVGGDGDDILLGGAGADILRGQGGADMLDGGADNDRLFGNALDDTLIGGDGNDRLDGQGGADRLDGGAGDDVMRAGTGNDVIDGGEGRDLLVGEAGRDVFVFERLDGDDVIIDWEDGFDRIDLSGHDAYESFADVQANMIQSGVSVRIQIDSVTDRIVLHNTDLADMDASDFMF